MKKKGKRVNVEWKRRENASAFFNGNEGKACFFHKKTRKSEKEHGGKANKKSKKRNEHKLNVPKLPTLTSTEPEDDSTLYLVIVLVLTCKAVFLGFACMAICYRLVEHQIKQNLEKKPIVGKWLWWNRETWGRSMQRKLISRCVEQRTDTKKNTCQMWHNVSPSPLCAVHNRFRSIVLFSLSPNPLKASPSIFKHYFFILNDPLSTLTTICLFQPEFFSLSSTLFRCHCSCSVSRLLLLL